MPTLVVVFGVALFIGITIGWIVGIVLTTESDSKYYRSVLKEYINADQLIDWIEKRFYKDEDSKELDVFLTSIDVSEIICEIHRRKMKNWNVNNAKKINEIVDKRR